MLQSLSTISLLSILVGIVILFKALVAHNHKDRVIFDERTVRLFREGLWGEKLDKTLPYTDFKGVLLHEVIVVVRDPHGRSTRIVYHRVTLLHPEEKLSAKLYQQRSFSAAREIWEIYAQSLGLPAIETDGDDYSVTEAEEINATLQERSARQSLSSNPHQLNDLDKVPEDLEIYHNREKGEPIIQIRLLPRRIEFGYGWLLPAALIGLSIMSKFDFSLFLLGLGIAAAMAVYQKLDDRYKRSLTLTRSHIELHDVLNYDLPALLSPDPSAARTRKFPIKQIKKILLKKHKGRLNYLLITTKQGQFTVGSSMSQDTLEWLQNYLRLAVIQA